MIEILEYSTFLKTFKFKKDNEIFTVKYEEVINVDPLLTFVFHTLLMMEIYLLNGDDILEFSYKCFSDETRTFESYENFVNEMCKLNSLSEDEKHILRQTNKMEKTVCWHME